MNIQELGSLGELIAAIATVATLIYLSIQVKHSRLATESNTRQMRGEAFVHLNASSRALWSWCRDHPKEMEIIIEVNEAPWKDLAPEKERLAMFWLGEETAYYEMAFMLWQEGALDTVSYTSREDYFLMMLESPGRRDWWDKYTNIIDPRFRERIEAQRKLPHDSLAKRFPMYTPQSSEGSEE